MTNLRQVWHEFVAELSSKAPVADATIHAPSGEGGQLERSLDLSPADDLGTWFSLRALATFWL